MNLQTLVAAISELQILADDYGDHITEEEFEFIADVVDTASTHGTEAFDVKDVAKIIKLRNKYANVNFSESLEGDSE